MREHANDGDGLTVDETAALISLYHALGAWIGRLSADSRIRWSFATRRLEIGAYLWSHGIDPTRSPPPHETQPS